MISTTIGAFGPAPRMGEPDFDELAEAFAVRWETAPGEINAWALEVNLLAAELSADAAAAEIAATTAEEAAAAAVAQGDAEAYASGTSYAQYAVAIGSDGRAYRRLSAGSGVDPVGDLTGAWVALNPEPGFLTALVLTGGICPGWSCQAQDADGTYPPTDPESPAQYVFARGVERYKAAITYVGSGVAEGAIETATFTRSVNSGGSYSSIGVNDVLTLTYDAEGYPIAQAWS